MKVLYITEDYGDGSAGVRFYNGNEVSEAELVEMMNTDEEGFWANEGQVKSFIIPDGDNTIRFSSLGG